MLLCDLSLSLFYTYHHHHHHHHHVLCLDDVYAHQVSLRTQCLGIAGTYTFISTIGVFLARYKILWVGGSKLLLSITLLQSGQYFQILLHHLVPDDRLPSLMLHSPASYIKLEEAMTKENHDTDFALINKAINNTAISTNSTEEQETATDELEAITNHLIRQVGQNAIESE